MLNSEGGRPLSHDADTPDTAVSLDDEVYEELVATQGAPAWTVQPCAHSLQPPPGSETDAEEGQEAQDVEVCSAEQQLGKVLVP